MAKKFKKPMIISGIVLIISIILVVLLIVQSVENDVLFMTACTMSALSLTSLIISTLFFIAFSFVTSSETKNVSFKTVEYKGCATLENNFDGIINNPKWDDVFRYMNIMFDNDDEFATLTLSEAIYGIRYMQACRMQGRISVQLGLEENNATQLVEKICDKEQAIKYMYDFYQFGSVDDVANFAPVNFL